MTMHPPSRSRPRIEYLGFRNVEESREYTYAVHSTEGACRFQFRIALAAFARSRVLLQDGPDVCYQQLVRELETGDNVDASTRSIHEGELRAYHDAHTPAPRTGPGSARAQQAAAPSPDKEGDPS